MKHIKKIFALVLAVMMIAAMSVSAFAADGDVSLTVNGAVTGHTYSYWQLFTGDLSEGTLSNVKWGADVASSIEYYEKANADATTFTVKKTISPTVGEPVPQAVLDYLASLTGKTDTNAAQATADIISAWVKGTGTAITNTTQVAKGYYVIKDAYTDSTAKQTTTLSTNIVAVVDATTITPKASTVESKKKVDDANDSDTTAEADNKTLQDSADHDIGDSIQYTLTFKLPSNYADYKHYYVKFTDTLTSGLTYNGDAKIFFGASDTTGANINFGSGLNLAYEIMDLKSSSGSDAQKALAANDVITIKYTCTLNENAVIGGSGNPNTYGVEYSSNPNNTGDGISKPDTSKTPDDTVIVFTYKTVFSKVDENGQALAGADFTLNKWVNGVWVNVTALHTAAGSKNPSKTSTKSSDTLTSADTFTFAGLDDGKYQLVESTTPAGYNTMEPLVFWIVAEHTAEDDSPSDSTLTTFKIMNEDKSKQIDGTNMTFTATKSDGTAAANIVNNSGATLPTTGGIGTTIFYVTGAVLALGAGILLITKRRMNR